MLCCLLSVFVVSRRVERVTALCDWSTGCYIASIPSSETRRVYTHCADAPRIRCWRSEISSKTLNYMNSRCSEERTIVKTSGLYNLCSYSEVQQIKTRGESERSALLCIRVNDTLFHFSTLTPVLLITNTFHIMYVL